MQHNFMAVREDNHPDCEQDRGASAASPRYRHFRVTRSLERLGLTVAMVALFGAALNDANGGATVTTLHPDIDNTLVETTDGALSLGASIHIFSGRIGFHAGLPTLRRALLRFDIAGAIPEGAVIESATLMMYVQLTNAGPQPMTLHRCLASWGEGTSDGFGGAGAPSTRGDATWLHRFWPDVPWENPGGDFDREASAEAVVGFIGPYEWTSETLAADVQAWLDDPDGNHGWMVIGYEDEIQTVKAFASRHHPDPSTWPTLVITWSMNASLPADINADGTVDGADLGELLAQWGPCPGGGVPCPADLDSNGAIDGADIGILLAAWFGGAMDS